MTRNLIGTTIHLSEDKTESHDDPNRFTQQKTYYCSLNDAKLADNKKPYGFNRWSRQVSCNTEGKREYIVQIDKTTLMCSWFLGYDWWANLSHLWQIWNALFKNYHNLNFIKNLKSNLGRLTLPWLCILLLTNWKLQKQEVKSTIDLSD